MTRQNFPSRHVFILSRLIIGLMENVTIKLSQTLSYAMFFFNIRNPIHLHLQYLPQKCPLFNTPIKPPPSGPILPYATE